MKIPAKSLPDALKRLDALIAQGDGVVATIHKVTLAGGYEDWKYDSKQYDKWGMPVRSFVFQILPAEHPEFSITKEFGHGHYPNISIPQEVSRLRGLRESLEFNFSASNSAVDAFEQIQKICDRFHNIARQLRHRHGGRPTLDIADEYDVQDLVHALLKLDFDDVRAEEWTPSYAGGSARMDFLLKSEQIVVELKMSRRGMTAKTLGEELIIDCQKYKEHPDCKRLICFVYDPQGIIVNPRGIEADLSRDTNEIPITVYIRPE